MWQGIYGHDDVVERFRRSIACGRLASTYLFVGPEGIGKRTFAEALAKALLCQTTSDEALEACGRCESCRLFDAGNHPDYDEVSLPAGRRTLSIDLFVGDREHRNQAGLCHSISLRPSLGRRRAAIIDDADWLSVESANCLLKTLEEPPEGALLILIGTSRSRQLPTILSRAQVVRFSPPDPEAAAQLLLEKQLVADPAQAAELASAAEGSLARAAELADGTLWELRQQLAGPLAAGEIDVARLASQLSEQIQSAGNEAEQRRQRFRQIVGLAIDIYRQQLRTLAAPERTREPTDSLTPVVAALDRCLEAQEQINRNANQTILLETWLSDLADLGSCGRESRRDRPR